MPFIGKQPKVGAFQLIDSITTSATATYALAVDGSAYFPETARNLIVSLNGVTQAPDSAYTVSGSNIVFASALTTSDVIDYILVIGDAVDIGIPSDGTIGNAQLASNIDLSGKTLTFANDQISGDAIDGGTASLDGLTVDTNTLVVDSTNNRVGIGEGTPLARIHVTGENLGSTQYDKSQLCWFENNNGNESYLEIFSFRDTAGSDWTTSSTRIEQRIDTTSQAYIQFNGTDNNYGISFGAGSGVTGADSEDLIERMRITATGTVGIGVTDPASELEVAGTILASPILYSSNQDEAYLIAGTAGWTGATTNWNTFGFQHRIKTDSNGVPRITIDNSAEEVFSLTNSSKVGIGTTNPSPKFHVTDVSGGGARIDGGSATHTESAYLWFQNGRARFGFDHSRGAVAISDYNQSGVTTGKAICFDTGGAERMRLLSTGSLLFGKTTANVHGADGIEFLDNGTIYATVPNSSTNTYHLYNRSSAAYLMYVKGNGGINNVQGNNVNLSDERSKKEIVDSGEWLNKLCQIPVRNFRYKHEDDSGKIHLGVVSQEVEAVAPELVEKNSFEIDGEGRDSVYTGDLQFAMLKAIQEQQAIIEDLQTRLSALEAN